MATRNISVDDLLAADSKSQSAQKFINDYDADSNTFVQALKNVPSSARQFGNDIIQPFIHPIKKNLNLVFTPLIQHLDILIKNKYLKNI